MIRNNYNHRLWRKRKEFWDFGKGNFSLSLPSGNIAGWNIPVFNWKYIFNPGPFSLAMLVYQSVNWIVFSESRKGNSGAKESSAT